MAISNTQICNIALTILSAERILSLTDESENARRCNVVFEMLRDTLLTEHNWNFARKEAVLARLAEDPKVEEFAFIYQLPSDCLRFMRIEDDVKFMIKGRKVYTNADTVNCEYVARVTDPNEFSYGFINALANRIAYTLCFGITQNADMTAVMRKESDRALEEAKFSDGQEGTGTFPIDGTLITARY
jgi:hypothetical protein